MKLTEIERKARALVIKDTRKYSKKDLVKAIQRKEGNFDCFGSASSYCDQLACCWRNDCLK
ncbi:MAG: SAP domain-containing protein [Candidatus Omnitrophica bacterium CG23_combo_of_CG06-09_8_20_14_all_40_11]|nr:MAG: SAP domain-containing protein [Candidatus Omnitrophica bacterium CG23_combo_of_CG06-09_8_20_14_all_40_11]